MVLSKTRITKALIRLRRCAGWSAPVLFVNPRRHVFLRQGPVGIIQKISPNMIYHNIPSSLIVITIYLIQAMVTQAERFLAEGVPLHGIGLQSHLKPYHVDITAIKVTIQIEICMCCFPFYF